MMQFVAVQGCALLVAVAGGAGTATVTGVPSTTVSAGTPAFSGSLDFVINTGAGIPGTCQSVAPFPGTIPATAVSGLIDGAPACREMDQVTVTVPGQTPALASCSFPATVSILSAGQVKVRCS